MSCTHAVVSRSGSLSLRSGSLSLRFIWAFFRCLVCPRTLGVDRAVEGATPLFLSRVSVTGFPGLGRGVIHLAPAKLMPKLVVVHADTVLREKEA